MDGQIGKKDACTIQTPLSTKKDHRLLFSINNVVNYKASLSLSLSYTHTHTFTHTNTLSFSQFSIVQKFKKVGPRTTSDVNFVSLT